MVESREKIKSFMDLRTWQEAHKLVLLIYFLTKEFPSEEKFGLVNQMRRAVVSITSNIAEGFSRKSYKEKVQFYSQSMGSLTEIQNQLVISRDVHYLSVKHYNQASEQLVLNQRILNGLIKKSKSIIYS